MTADPSSQTSSNSGQNYAKLSTDHLPRAAIETIDNAIIAPAEGQARFPYGVFRPDGSPCHIARTLLGRGRFTDVAEHPGSPEQHLKGRYLFGGLARLHFGHFLLESIPRLWAAVQLQDNLDGIIFLHHPTHELRKALQKEYAFLYLALGRGIPFHFVKRSTQVEKLYVPTQGFGHNHWITGTPEFRTHIRDNLTSIVTANGPERLYISRSQLKERLPAVDQEEKIERLMKAAGYTIFHPQLHSIKEQCEHYLAARHVVGGDGSAFHLAAFFFQPETKVGLIQRRNRPDVYASFLRQIAAFSTAEVTSINPLLNASPSHKALEEPIDFQHLKAALSSNGFID